MRRMGSSTTCSVIQMVGPNGWGSVDGWLKPRSAQPVFDAIIAKYPVVKQRFSDSESRPELRARSTTHWKLALKIASLHPR